MSASVRLRHLAQINPATPEFDELPADAEVTFLPLEAVWPGTQLDIARLCPKAEVATGYTRFLEGDVLIPKITPTFEADRSVIAVGLKDGVGAGTTELHIIRPGTETDRRYIKYLVSSRSFLLGGEAEMFGVAGQKRVSDSWLRNFPVLVTTKSRQTAIADFLDAETVHIDALISKKVRLIALLEHRLAVKIEMLLTGRDKSHVQKASTDIPSIPEVPSSWKLRRNKTFLLEVNKPSLDGQEELLSVSHITGVTSRSLKEVNMFMAESLEGYKMVSVGDLVINTMWAWMGAAGTSYIEGIVSPAYGVYRFDQSIMLPQFFDGLVRTRAYIDEMTRFSKGVWSSRLRLYGPVFK